MSPNEKDVLSDEDELASAPESGQPLGGRDNNPWDDDDEPAGVAHAWPAEHHEPPGNDL